MSKKGIVRWELLGFFFIALFGAAFHFCYEWSGSYKPLALFCAVNESVWEHLKMGFWPALFFAIAEYFVFGKKLKNFWVAKTLALYIMPILIVILYYSAKAILGDHSFWIDIAIFNIAIAVSQIISCRIITSYTDYGKYRTPAYIFLAILIAAFSLFTFFPPNLELFKDSNTGNYGIPSK